MKLTKAEQTAKADHVEALDGARDRYVTAAEAYNTAIKDAWEEFNPAREEFNAAMEAATEFTEAVAERLEDYIEDKSDTWKDGPKGKAVIDWRERFARFEPDSIDMDEPGAADTDIELWHEKLDELEDES